MSMEKPPIEPRPMVKHQTIVIEYTGDEVPFPALGVVELSGKHMIVAAAMYDLLGRLTMLEDAAVALLDGAVDDPNPETGISLVSTEDLEELKKHV